MAIERHYFFAGIVTPEDRRWSCLRQSVPCQKEERFSTTEERMRAIHRGRESRRREEERKKSSRGGGQRRACILTLLFETPI